MSVMQIGFENEVIIEGEKLSWLKKTEDEGKSSDLDYYFSKVS
jgi:hypothetical protein